MTAKIHARTDVGAVEVIISSSTAQAFELLLGPEQAAIMAMRIYGAAMQVTEAEKEEQAWALNDPFSTWCG
jgi:hypothetical protein